MISFFVAFIVLIVGYLLYGKFMEKIFAVDARIAPSKKFADGVDFIALKKSKAFLIELLNIAGTGPIFGALMGAVFGPVVFLWIVLGSILGGAVHDYMSGMISCRHKGQSIAEISGEFFGKKIQWLIRIISILLLLLIGTVFITSPATLLAAITPSFLSKNIWLGIIVLYYILATLMPIDKIIGKFYPIFGAVLIIMALSIIGGIMLNENITMPEFSLQNMHPENLPIWPFMFITVACGAISGFHATQAPIIAKCISIEEDGRFVFYGAMICEAMIALIWAAAGVAFYATSNDLLFALDTLGQSGVVYTISKGLLGNIGALLAVIAVVICPITSGDTAFRGARLLLAEWLGLEQKSIKNRLLITIPCLIVAVLLTQLKFSVLWRYSAWINQTLAMIALWVATAYLINKAKNKWYSLATALPAAFMTSLCVSYILMADEGFALSQYIIYPISIIIFVVSIVIYLNKCFKCNR